MSRSLCIKLGAGSEPECIEIDDAREAVGDHGFDDFGDVIELCFNSPRGQCEYSAVDNFERCIHCKKKGSGL